MEINFMRLVGTRKIAIYKRDIELFNNMFLRVGLDLRNVKTLDVYHKYQVVYVSIKDNK